MIFHGSIDADEPCRVAEVIAELRGGEALPFAPVIAGSWMALAGDARGSGVEVDPRGTELVVGDGAADAHGVAGAPDRRSAIHLAVATEMDLAEVHAIAQREGREAKYRRRGGIFGVVELWIENCRMVAVLTPAMQGGYVAGMTIPIWSSFLRSSGVPLAA